MQRIILPHPLLVETFNLYYAVLHFPVLIGCLIWLFAWHRGHYRRVRTTVVLFTGVSLLIQFIPVAPPRMLTGTGLVDTAALYGQSVYGSLGIDADQFSAMPSVHVGWALIVAIAVITASRSRWRWLAVLYPAVTTLVVVATANHFWLDGVAAAVLVVAAMGVQRAARTVRARVLTRHGRPPRPLPRIRPPRPLPRARAPRPLPRARAPRPLPRVRAPRPLPRIRARVSPRSNILLTRRICDVLCVVRSSSRAGQPFASGGIPESGQRTYRQPVVAVRRAASSGRRATGSELAGWALGSWSSRVDR